MIRNWPRLVFVTACLMSGWITEASAQSNLMMGHREITPAQNLPALPEGANPQADPGAAVAAAGEKAGVPALPPARVCSAQDVVGIWRLARLYEVPPGPETALYATSQIQYLIFNSDSTYSKLNAGNTDMTPFLIRQAIKEQNAGLQQFVVGTGMLYLYQDSVAIDTQACFIVFTSKGPFLQGQMLLLPPVGQTQTRLIKVYDRYFQNANKRRGRGKRPPRRPRRPAARRGYGNQ